MNYPKTRGIGGYNEDQRPLSASAIRVGKICCKHKEVAKSKIDQRLVSVSVSPEGFNAGQRPLSASEMIRLPAETERGQAKNNDLEA